MDKKANWPDWQSGFEAVLAAYQRRDFQTASDKAQDLLAFYPDQAALLNMAALSSVQSGRVREAADFWQRIPDAQKSHSVLNNLGNACRQDGRLADAERHIRASLVLRGDNVEAWWNLVLTLTLTQADRPSEALAATEEMLKLSPQDARALAYAGMLAFNRGDFARAVAHQQALLAQQPDNRQLWLDYAAANRRLKRYAEAERAYRRALSQSEEDADAWFGVAKMCHFQQKYQEACAALMQVLAREPERLDAQNDLVLNLLYLPEQAQAAADAAWRLGEMYVRRAPVGRPSEKARPKRRLRIGLVSSDLRRHPVGMFAKGLLLSDVAGQFAWTAYANSAVFDEVSREIRPRFEAWHQIRDWSDAQVVGQIVSDGIDILIDLNGHTAGHRMGVFAAQAAPVQISWLGYFATTGLPTVQAVIADEYCVPTSEEKWFREKVYRLPHTRLCMTPPHDAPEVGALPALSNGHITFGCFQNLTKLNDTVLKTWALLARKMPQAHWRFQSARLAEGSDEQRAFAQKLRELGFSDGTLHFAGHSGMSDYLAAHRQIDVILDTFPFPGGTTTVDALWMGVPTLTFALPGMLGRQGEQFLRAAGLSDWVCRRWEDYLQRALYWGDTAHFDQLARLRSQLRAQAAAGPVFDTQRFGRDWADLVKRIWQDACEGRLS